MYFAESPRQREFLDKESERLTISDKDALRRALDELIDIREADQLAE